MNKSILPASIALLVFALAGCNREAQPVAASEPAPRAAATPAPADRASDVEIRTLETALPEGVTLDMRYHLVRDEVRQNSKGRENRLVAAEFLEGNAADALRSVRASLRAAGFRPLQVTGANDAGVLKLEDGSLRTDFSKKGYGGRVSVVAKPYEPGTGKHPDALGKIAITWISPLAESTATAAVSQ